MQLGRPLALLLTVSFWTVTTNAITLFDGIPLNGTNITITELDGCLSLKKLQNGAWDDRVRSINTWSKCVFLHEDDDCSGRTLALYPGSKATHSNLSEFNFSAVATSMSLCKLPPCLGEWDMEVDFRRLQHDEELKRRERLFNDTYCLFDDEFFTGKVPGLPVREHDDPGPITLSQVNPSNLRVEYVRAVVEQRHLHSGSEVSPCGREFALRLGHPLDEAGQVVPSRLGGSGSKRGNLFPRSPTFRLDLFHQNVVDEAVSSVLQFGNTTFEVNLQYGGPNDTRPYCLAYRIHSNGENKKYSLNTYLINF